MADAYPDYDPDNYETVPSSQGQTPAPSMISVSPVRKSMGSVEIGVIAIAIAVAILTCSAALSLSKR